MGSGFNNLVIKLLKPDPGGRETMPRRVRMHFHGALYHVFARGNNKEDIFRSGKDKDKYVELIKKYKGIFGFKLYAFALMDNHVHLLIQVGDDPLSKIMQGIQQSYTQYFNKKYERVGHVFQQRYKCNICGDNEYLITLLKYIHYNPAKGNLASGLHYKWSSHDEYVNNKSEFIDTEDFFKRLGRKKSESMQWYREIMLNSDDKFLEEYKSAYIEVDTKEVDEKNDSIMLKLEDVVEQVINNFNISEEELLYARNKGVEARMALVFICIRDNIVCRDELSKYLGVGKSRVSQLYYEGLKIWGQALII